MEKKKIIMGIVIVGVIFILGISIYFSYQNSIDKTKYITDHDYLYDIAIEYFRNQNDDSYQTEEDYQQLIAYQGFGVSEDDDYKYVYMHILEESFYVKNNKLYEGSGSSIPYKFIFKDDQVINYEMPKDGDENAHSMKQIFPKKVYDKIVKYDIGLLVLKVEQQKNEHYSYLKSTEVNYASSYKFSSFELITNNKEEVKEYYKSSEQTIYLVGADELYIEDFTNSLEEQTFKNYISSTSKTIDNAVKKLTDELDQEDIFKDGRSIRYRNNEISVIKCNTIAGNKDIYIGADDLEYRDNFCK